MFVTANGAIMSTDREHDFTITGEWTDTLPS
ncbi:hypothetical protein CLV40_1072 [Actinokineospora auranticolor]|uniref:Uncharacterized protein n=1 Tax=Actinokineospora auranticolor TaxID=155976 RepID=A0A2S6GQ47_9PSEU|nr:hypothetical protein CLV40_1072 [Actinokineospora auranticolor]